MKKLLIVVLLLIMGMMYSTTLVSAEGGKVRGDESVDPTYQLGDCPFIG